MLALAKRALHNCMLGWQELKEQDRRRQRLVDKILRRSPARRLKEAFDLWRSGAGGKHCCSWKESKSFWTSRLTCSGSETMRERVWLPGAALSPRSKAALAGRAFRDDHEDDVVREEAAGVSPLGVEHARSCLADEGGVRCWRREKVFRESRVFENPDPWLALLQLGVVESASSVDGVPLSTLFLRPAAGVVNENTLPAEGLPPTVSCFVKPL